MTTTAAAALLASGIPSLSVQGDSDPNATTRAKIEQLGGEALDLVFAEAAGSPSLYPFKGTIDVERLEETEDWERTTYSPTGSMGRCGS
jgi:hypothetical protein